MSLNRVQDFFIADLGVINEIPHSAAAEAGRHGDSAVDVKIITTPGRERGVDDLEVLDREAAAKIAVTIRSRREVKHVAGTGHRCGVTIDG